MHRVRESYHLGDAADDARAAAIAKVSEMYKQVEAMDKYFNEVLVPVLQGKAKDLPGLYTPTISTLDDVVTELEGMATVVSKLEQELDVPYWSPLSFNLSELREAILQQVRQIFQVGIYTKDNYEQVEHILNMLDNPPVRVRETLYRIILARKLPDRFPPKIQTVDIEIVPPKLMPKGKSPEDLTPEEHDDIVERSFDYRIDPHKPIQDEFARIKALDPQPRLFGVTVRNAPFRVAPEDIKNLPEFHEFIEESLSPKTRREQDMVIGLMFPSRPRKPKGLKGLGQDDSPPDLPEIGRPDVQQFMKAAQSFGRTHPDKGDALVDLTTAVGLVVSDPSATEEQRQAFVAWATDILADNAWIYWTIGLLGLGGLLYYFFLRKK